MTSDSGTLIAETLAAHRPAFPRVACLCGWPGPTPDYDWAKEHQRHVADAILAGLNGRLLPDGGETREEWRVGGYSARSGDFVAVLALPDTEEETIAEAACGWSSLGYDARAEVCTVTTWPDGQQHRSSWRLVETEPQP